MITILDGNNEPQGPYSVEQIHDYYHQGLIHEHTLAHAEGLADWAPLPEVLEHVSAPAQTTPPSQSTPNTAPNLRSPQAQVSSPISQKSQAQLTQEFTQKIQQEQNLFLAIVGGVGAALVGSLLWMAVQILLNLQIGYLAIGIGFGVGYAVRYLGKGLTPLYGVIAGGLTFLSCMIGEMLAIIFAASANSSLGEVLSKLDIGQLFEAWINDSGIITWIIYLVGISAAYRSAHRTITPEELAAAGIGSPQKAP